VTDQNNPYILHYDHLQIIIPNYSSKNKTIEHNPVQISRQITQHCWTISSINWFPSPLIQPSFYVHTLAV